MGLTLELDDVPDSGVWETHVAAWNAWCAVSGQMRLAVAAGMGGIVRIWQGLDYTGARAGLDLAGIAVTPELWDEVREIEAGAVEELNASEANRGR